MSDKRLIPKVRFEGFDDEWREKELANITKRVRGNDGRLDIPTLTISAANGWMDQRDRFYGNIAGKEQKNYTLLKNGELSYNKGNSKFAKYGVVYELTDFSEGLVPKVYHSFSANPDIESSYLEYYFHTKRPDKQLGEFVTTTARMDGLLNISYDDFMKVTINYPSLNEQKAIASFFRSIDKGINKYENYIKTISDFKQAMLQKMFPKEGETVPEVRFEGFNKEWEITKLDDVAEFYSGGTPSVGNKKYYNGNIPFIRSAEINKSSTELYISEVGLKNSSAKMVDIGTILYALYGATSGEVGISKINGAINQAILAIKPSSNYDSNFIMQWLKYQKNNITDKYLQGGQGNLSGSIIKKIQIMIPSLSEQKLIGEYFYKLDQNIQSKQAELDKLKQFKQAMLDKMFV